MVPLKPKLAHVHVKDHEFGFYVEEKWCAERIFDVEGFGRNITTIIDPHCGWGTIPAAAMRAGYMTLGSDIVDRGAAKRVPGLYFTTADFYSENYSVHKFGDIGAEPISVSIVTNPPFDHVEATVRRALRIAHKVATIVQWSTVPAAKWLQTTPLARVWLMTPRPSMPPGHYIEAGGKVGGGTQDFCWLVFEQEHRGAPTMQWLTRRKYDGAMVP